MAIAEGILAIIGLGFLALMAIAALDKDPAKLPKTEDDPALPYREALEAAIRIQQAAEEAEQRIHTEAASRAATERRPERESQ